MNSAQINSHILANKKLDLIRGAVVVFIKNNIGKITEHDVNDYIYEKSRQENMYVDKKVIRYFTVINENSDDTHWNKSHLQPRLITKNSLLLIDTWAKVKNDWPVFADITWMFYVGQKIPSKIQYTFNQVIAARDAALLYIRKELRSGRLPISYKVDAFTRNYFKYRNLDKYFTHRTGHSIGTHNCHGKYFGISKSSRKIIRPNIPFTIEPGLYYRGEFGIRSEINCYITKKLRLIVTSSVQREITKI